MWYVAYTGIFPKANTGGGGGTKGENFSLNGDKELIYASND